MLVIWCWCAISVKLVQSCFGSLKWFELISAYCRTNKGSWTFCVRLQAVVLFYLLPTTNPPPHEIVGCLILSCVWPTTNLPPHDLLCYTDKGCTSSGKIIQKYTYWVCGISLWKKAYMANEILRMGVLNYFKELS
jgi:hypothetical protein